MFDVSNNQVRKKKDQIIAISQNRHKNRIKFSTSGKKFSSSQIVSEHAPIMLKTIETNNNLQPTQQIQMQNQSSYNQQKVFQGNNQFQQISQTNYGQNINPSHVYNNQQYYANPQQFQQYQYQVQPTQVQNQYFMHEKEIQKNKILNFFFKVIYIHGFKNQTDSYFISISQTINSLKKYSN
ncbi:hypothetical protein ABPG72_011564 [Tetrahymena utriculariae]